MKLLITLLKVLGYIPMVIIIWLFVAIVTFFFSFKYSFEALFEGKTFILSKMVKL
jgi:hypothetical protein